MHSCPNDLLFSFPFKLHLFSWPWTPWGTQDELSAASQRQNSHLMLATCGFTCGVLTNLLLPMGPSHGFTPALLSC